MQGKVGSSLGHDQMEPDGISLQTATQGEIQRAAAVAAAPLKRWCVYVCVYIYLSIYTYIHKYT